MKKALLSLVVLICFLPALQGQKLPSPSQKKIKKLSKTQIRKIRFLLRQMKQASGAKKRVALAKRLIQMGPGVAPYIKKQQSQISNRLYIYMFILESLKKQGPLPTPPETKDFVAIRVQWAKTALLQGKYAYALGILKALQVLVTRKNKYKDEIVRLKIRAEELYLRKHYLFASLSTKRKVYRRGAMVKIQMVLENPSNQTIRIDSPRSGVLGRVVIRERVFDLYGNNKSRSLYHSILSDRSIEIRGKGQWKYSFLLNTKGLSERAPGQMMAYDFQGYLRPRLIQTEKKNYSRYIGLGPKQTIFMVDLQYVSLAKNPLQGLITVLASHRQTLKNLWKGQKRSNKLNKTIFEFQLDLQTLLKGPSKNKEMEKKLTLLIERTMEDRDKILEKIKKLDKKGRHESLEIFYRASFLQEPAQREKAIMEICYSLSNSFGLYEKILTSLLSRLTGKSLSLKKREWLIWCFKKYGFK